MTRLTVIEGGQTGNEGPNRVVLPEKAPAGLLEDLYQRYAPSVYGRCRYLLKDAEAARDATQEVFVRVLRALPQFRAASSPITWLMQIATNYCLNLLRANRAAWREEIRRIAQLNASATAQPDRRELVRALLRAVPDEAREVAVLYYVDELTQAEIAEVTGRSLPTVRKRLREFLAAARASLAEAVPGLSFPEGEGP